MIIRNAQLIRIVRRVLSGGMPVRAQQLCGAGFNRPSNVGRLKSSPQPESLFGGIETA